MARRYLLNTKRCPTADFCCRGARKGIAGVVLVLLSACAASSGEKIETAAEPQEVIDASPVAGDTDVPGESLEDVPAPGKPELFLDRTQRTVEGVVTSAAQSMDNLFGSADVEEEATLTRGHLSVGGQWDERDGLRERIRLKARFALPALENRTSLLLGRGEADDFVDGSNDDNIDTLPDRFNDFQDEDWLLGIGYSRDSTMKRGWSFGAGVRLRTPVEPYVRATYRWHRAFSDDWLWRLEPRVFLQSQRGAGLSVQNVLDHVLTDDWLLRSWSVLVAEEDVEGISWTTKLVAYNSLTDKSAMSYALYGSGETEHEVPIRDYGVEVTYRRQISREWLFVELLTYVNWPRDFLVERRELNVGVGIEFEMQFGDWPGRPSQE